MPVTSKRHVSLVENLIVLLALVLLMGCGGEDPKDDPKKQGDETAKEETESKGRETENSEGADGKAKEAGKTKPGQDSVADQKRKTPHRGRRGRRSKRPETPMQIWAELMEGNKRFMSGHPSEHDSVKDREAAAEDKPPRAVILTCSDSAMSPELIFDKGFGSLFVVRTPGHVADGPSLGGIEYAVERLRSKLIVVLGHDQCGAVSLAVSGYLMPTPNLMAIVSGIKPALEKYEGAAKGERLVGLGVSSNVRRVAEKIHESPIIQRAMDNGKLKIIRAVFNRPTGSVSPLR